MRKKGLVERLIFKEPTENDFSYAKLPKNRKELLSYMIKNKLGKIYKNHLLIALFFIPLIAWAVMTMNYTDFVFSLEASEGVNHLFEHWVTVYVTAIPLWALAFVGLAGGLNVTKKLAWSDPVMLKRDFFKGIRSSGKQLALLGALWGTAYALLRFAIDWLGLYYKATGEDLTAAFGIFVCLFVLVMLIGYTAYATCMASTYNVNLKQLFAGAFKLYLSDVFLATGVILLCLLPILPLMLSELAIAILIIYLLLLGLLIGFLIIPIFLVCQHTFDRVINKKDYPSYYGKGLSYGSYERDDALQINVIPEEAENADHADDAENDFERVNDGDN